MALLVEGLDVGPETSIEEYILGPAHALAGEEFAQEKEQMTLYGPEEGLSWVARPIPGQSSLALVSRHGSTVSHGPASLVDPVVSLFGSVHERMPEMGSMRSMPFPNFGSMFSVAENNQKQDHWDEESLQREGDDYVGGTDNEGEYEENLRSPLISRQTTTMEGKDLGGPHGSVFSGLGMRRRSSLLGEGDQAGSVGIGGGWQLAWRWEEKEGSREGGFKRVYLHQEGVPGSRRGSLMSVPGVDFPAEGEYIQAAALVSQSALYPQKLVGGGHVGPAMVHPSAAASKGPVWKDLLDAGVRHALLVGIGLQVLQQVCIVS